MAKRKKVAEITPEQVPGKRELVVITKREAGLRASPSGMRSMTNTDISTLDRILEENKCTMTPLFGMSEEAITREFAAASPSETQEGERFQQFYHIDAPDDQLDNLCDQFNADENVEGAYVKPAGEAPRGPVDIAPDDSQLAPTGITGAPALPPNFSARQGYLNVAPEGVDARYAWRFRGGRGDDVRIIDLEWGWRFNHIDLRRNQGGVLAGNNSTSDHHGTAVLGEYSGDPNSFGIIGICPNAWAAAVSFTTLPTSRAIRIAADRLRPGDIMLLEIHRAGPRHNFRGRADQRGYIAIEWWPDDFLAIRYATRKGIIVVSAAGNGAQNFDDPLYDRRPAGFPSWWSNPFNRNPLDSGSILIGAGAPPPGTHGRTHGNDRSRLGFSNYGAAVDAQGWGQEVTTTGYGDLWRDPADPNNRDRWFTDTFNGTSSASPIVVGALGCVQGYLKGRRIPTLTPATARALLRSTGSPQQDTPGRPRTQRIGNRPNLRQMIRRLSRAVVIRLGYEIDRCSGSLSVWDRNRRWIRVPRGRWTRVLVRVDRSGYWYWRCGSSIERSRGGSSWRHDVKMLYVYHSTTDRKITWWCYDIR